MKRKSKKVKSKWERRKVILKMKLIRNCNQKLKIMMMRILVEKKKMMMRMRMRMRMMMSKR